MPPANGSMPTKGVEGMVAVGLLQLMGCRLIAAGGSERGAHRARLRSDAPSRGLTSSAHSEAPFHGRAL